MRSLIGPRIRQAAPPHRPRSASNEVEKSNIPAPEPAPACRTETRHGVIYVIGRDGIAQPCASPRVAALVAQSLRNLGLA